MPTMKDQNAPFHALRVMLDARLPHAATIVVSSACDGDGQQELANGLVEAFAQAGRRSVLVSLYDGSATPAELGKLLADARAEHEVVVVASPPLPTHSAALDACRLADGVLLTVRLGRKIMPADHDTVAYLERAAATVLGVVAMRSMTLKGGAQPDIVVGASPALEAAAN